MYSKILGMKMHQISAGITGKENKRKINPLQLIIISLGWLNIIGTLKYYTVKQLKKFQYGYETD